MYTNPYQFDKDSRPIKRKRKIKNLLMNYKPKSRKDFNINRMFDRLKGDMYYHGN